MENSSAHEPAQRAQASRFLRDLHKQLMRVLIPEMELTMRVAVLSAAGHTRPQIVSALNSTDIEVKMALLRLQRIAHIW